MTQQEQIGTVVVDSGLVMVGDPGHVVHRAGDWGGFVNAVYADGGRSPQTDGVEPLGGGLGIVVGTASDGQYPVTATRGARGQITGLAITFSTAPTPEPDPDIVEVAVPRVLADAIHDWIEDRAACSAAEDDPNGDPWWEDSDDDAARLVDEFAALLTAAQRA